MLSGMDAVHIARSIIGLDEEAFGGKFSRDTQRVWAQSLVQYFVERAGNLKNAEEACVVALGLHVLRRAVATLPCVRSLSVFAVKQSFLVPDICSERLKEPSL